MGISNTPPFSGRLFVCGIILVFSGTWVLPVCDTSEARYAEVAREMAAGGSWLIPHLMDRPHLTKPPLTYWLSAISMKIFGPHAWAARLPVALAFLITVMMTADLGRRLWPSPAGGHWAGWALLLSALPLGASNILTADSLVALFGTASIWCAWRSITQSDLSRGRTWALGFYAALALAFLTKGPPGLLVALALVPFAFRYRQRYPFRRLLTPLGLSLFSVLALPWYLAVGLLLPGTFSYWLGTETVGRIFGDSHRNMPFILYIPILLGGALPAGFLLPHAARRLWRAHRSSSPDRAPAELLFWWMILPLAVFCLVRSRLPLYLLPLFPPLALLVGRWLALSLGDRTVPLSAATLIVAVAGGIWMGGRMGVFQVPELQEFLDLQPDPRPPAHAILADALNARVHPQAFATTPSISHRGNGLAFYLRRTLDPVDLRSRSEILAGCRTGRPLYLVLEQPLPKETYQYFLVTRENAEVLERRVRGKATGGWIFREGKLWVWRREG